MVTRDDNGDHHVPTLTEVACPGDRLKPAGLWLPLQPDEDTPPHQEDGAHWQERLPPELRERADALLMATRTRAVAALDRRLDRILHRDR